ncbi:MAG: hypothetical protein KDB07_02155 [Planctomycetes bacterium]|nr:hypothetical protein [Planctomycetota bacterium]
MAHPVDIGDLQEGMVVARDVFSKGQMLMQAGSVLSGALINTLERRGVTQVFIQDEEDKKESAKNVNTQILVRRLDDQLGKRATEKLNKALARVEAQFVGMDEDPVMGPLKIAAAKYWAQRAKQLDKATSEVSAN